MKQVKKNAYKCPKCGKVVLRKSTKQWIKSYCQNKGVITRIILQRNDDGKQLTEFEQGVLNKTYDNNLQSKPTLPKRK